ncbi:MAG TPA: hypothetical protein VF316_04010, partial [Polyangiaceae bacterium]
PDFYAVRLGMSPRDVRDRFTPAGGTWKSDAMADDYAIVWEPSRTPAPADPLEARFEFHMGILVAIRAKVPPSAAFAQGPRYVVTKAAVLRRLETRATNESTTPAPASALYTYIDVLARDCPTHHAEAQGFVTASETR